MLAISQLSHIYLAQFDRYFPRFSCFPFPLSEQNMKNSENIDHIELGIAR